MPELTAMEKPKIAGFVDRGFNHAKKQKQMEEAEAEIARLEAEARGETVEEQEESSSEDTENTEVQASDDSKQEETKEETKAQEDDDKLDAEEKSFKKRYGDIRKHLAAKEKVELRKSLML